MTPRERIRRSDTSRRTAPVGSSVDHTIEELDGRSVEVRAVQPYRAVKGYRCPGCHSPIPARTGHLVVVPVDEPDDRRHWHRSCWSRRLRRRPR